MFLRACSLVKFRLPLVMTRIDTWLSLASCTWPLVALSLHELSSPIRRTAIFLTPSLPPLENTLLMARMHWSVLLVLWSGDFSSFLTFSMTSNGVDRKPLVLTLPFPQTTNPILNGDNVIYSWSNVYTEQTYLWSFNRSFWLLNGYMYMYIQDILNTLEGLEGVVLSLKH